MELSPVQVYAQIATTVQFTCQYSSRLRFKLEFITFPDWNWLVANEAVRSSYLFQRFGDYRLPKGQGWWSLSLTADVPIFPKLQRVICRLVNERGEAVAEVYSRIFTGGIILLCKIQMVGLVLSRYFGVTFTLSI